MILTYHLNKDRIRPDRHRPEESLRIPLLNRGPVQVRILRPLGSSPWPQTIQQAFVVSRAPFIPNDSPEAVESPNVDAFLGLPNPAISDIEATRRTICPSASRRGVLVPMSLS